MAVGRIINCTSISFGHKSDRIVEVTVLLR